MTSFRAVPDEPAAAQQDAHTRVRVFAGPDADHRALCGTLTFRNSEAAEFIALVNDQAPQWSSVVGPHPSSARPRWGP